MRFLQGLAIGLVLAWVCSSRADLVRIRVKVLNASEVSDEYLGRVTRNVQSHYRNDLRIRTRFAVHKSSVVNHSEFISIEDRFNEFIAYSKILKRPRWNRVTFVATQPYTNANGCSHGAGLATWFGMGVVRGYESCTGADRFGSDWVTIAHEICHSIAYNRRRYGQESRCDHTPEERTDSIMHADALRYAANGLRFLRQTRRQIGDGIRSIQNN